VTTPDGINIAVRESGRPDGPEIVFIHGFSMGQLCWQKQVESHLADRFRLITYDLRGHGASDKPLEPTFYREGVRWAEELATVLDHARVRRPVLVAWSYGVRIVADYLAHYGPGRVAGLNLVGSKTNSDPVFALTTAIEHQRGMAFDDLGANIRHTIAFVESCARSWDAETFQTCLAMSMVVPPEIRAALMGRSLDIDDRLRSTEFPVHFTHGRFDGIIPLAAARHGHAITPGSTLSVFADSGHSPFMEEADRFNDELRDFVLRCP
jgi:pimeloyl-ACP methyl ester carboxylesterase